VAKTAIVVDDDARIRSLALKREGTIDDLRRVPGLRGCG